MIKYFPITHDNGIDLMMKIRIESYLRQRFGVLMTLSSGQSIIFNSLRSSRFLSFSRQRSKKRAIKRESAWGEQKIREKWGWGEREGGGGGEERNRLQLIPNILPNSVRPRTGSNSAISLVSSPSIKK